MDTIDRKILIALQDDASISIGALAEKVGLSQTPCWKRVQRLEATGVIHKRVALVRPEAVGFDITVYVQIEAGEHSATWLEQFAAQVADMPNVMELYRMAGEVDYMLRVAVPNMASYDMFYKQLVSTIPMKNVTSRFAMERIKTTTAYPISPMPTAEASHLKTASV